MAVIRLELRGTVPNKKNLWQPRKGGGMFLDAAIKAQINALIVQARKQWRRPPIEHPDMDIEFFVLNGRSDRDNKLGCLLDVLQEAGVLVNDNVSRSNGVMVVWPAVVGKVEGVIVDISEKQAALVG